MCTTSSLRAKLPTITSSEQQHLTLRKDIDDLLPVRNPTTRILWAWLPVGVWLALIALESTDFCSSAHTGSLLYGIATALFGHVDVHRFEVFHALLRKAGHFTGYAALSLLFFRALRQTFVSAAGRVGRWAWIVIMLTMSVAALDELNQSFILSRTGNLRDVVLDTFGALCMQVSVLAILRLRTYRFARQTSEVAD
jgi:VanZ family protein